MSIPIIYANTQYTSGQHIFNTIPNGTNLSLNTLANVPSCNVMTLINGNVGIGTLFPIQSLHVQNSSYFAGNIGIGTAQPSALFHINGDILSPVLVSQIAFFATSNAPIGWLKCNGNAVSRSSYASLFDKISTTYGSGDGFSTFTLPDLRGEFLRGWDDGRNIDTSRTFASAQAGAMLDHTHTGTTNSGEGTHTHTISDPGHTHSHNYGGTGNNNSLWHPVTAGRIATAAGDNAGSGTGAINGNTTGISINTTSSAHTHTMTTGNPSTGGGTETRPRNIALLACIKY